ncbi:MAG: GatB/YqeY domain-containing protein [Bacillota bacterium]
MDLKTRLLEDMQRSMKQREAGRFRLGVIRLARAAIKNAEVAQGRELDDAGVTEALAKEVKLRRDAVEEYQRLDRPDAVARLQEEIAVLLEYLPRQMSGDEVASVARRVMAEVGARGPGDLGRVMGRLIPEVRGKADGTLVRATVERLLAEETQ